MAVNAFSKAIRHSTSHWQGTPPRSCAGRRCPPPAAVQQSWTRLRPMIRWLAISRAGGQAPLAVHGPLRGPLNMLHAALRANLKTIRQHCTSWRKVFHQRRKRCDHGKGWCDVVGTATRQQPRATLSSRKQSRRPHEYLTPLLTAEAGQQWGRKDGATTVCLEPCLDKMCCVLQLQVKTS